MKNLVATILIGSIFIPSATMAQGIKSEHHEMCLKAADYLGCIKAMTAADSPLEATTTININQTNRPGLLSETGNECPVGFAYAGAGQCRAVICVGNGIFGRNDPALGGKGHSCAGGAGALRQGIFFGRGTLAWGNNYVPASINPNCPLVEPGFGWRSSCQGVQRDTTNPSNILPASSDKIVRQKAKRNCWSDHISSNPALAEWADANPQLAEINKSRFDAC